MQSVLLYIQIVFLIEFYLYNLSWVFVFMTPDFCKLLLKGRFLILILLLPSDKKLLCTYAWSIRALEYETLAFFAFIAMMTFRKIGNTWNDSEVIYEVKAKLRGSGKPRNIVAASRREREKDGRGREGKWILSVGWPRLARSGWLNYTFIN